MSNLRSLSFSKKGKKPGLMLGLGESGSFLKNIKLLKGKSRKNGQPISENMKKVGQLAQKCNTNGGQTCLPDIGANYETQLLRVSSAEESSLSGDEMLGERDCFSPVVESAAELPSSSPFQTSFNGDGIRKPSFKTGQHNGLAATASTTTLRKDDNGPFARGKLTRNGVKKDTVLPGQNSRGKLRRIHSMFASQKEASRSYDDPAPNTLHSPDGTDSSSLPAFNSRLEKSGISHYYDDKSDDHFPRIDVETLVGIMDGQFKAHYKAVHIVDCRFEYEYQGGHIGQAININTRDALESRFLRNSNDVSNCKQPSLMVFHCEFSSYRGPIMASHLRNCDRMLNHDNYPKLHYPDILVVKGGYKSFFDRYSSRCYPRCYIGMDSLEHVALCESEMEKFRKDSKKIATRASSTDSLGKGRSSSQPKLRRNTSMRLNGQSAISGMGGTTDHTYQSYYTNRSSLSFKYEAPPKLSFTSYCSSSESRSPSSVSSSNGSTGLLSQDELRDDTGSTDLDNVSFEDSSVSAQQQERTEPGFPMTNPKRSLFGSILREEEG